MNFGVVSRNKYRSIYGLVLLSTPFVFGATVCAQDSPSPSATQPPANSSQASPPTVQVPATSADSKTEVSMQDTGPTFKVHVNLVQVRVVVRDNNNNPVGNLRREDFLLYDQGKLQSISTFGVETPDSRRQRAEAAAKTQAGNPEESGASHVTLPDRFVALVFDDLHLSLEDANFIRVSSRSFIEAMAPNDRVAIFSTSGQVNQEFTSDKQALENTLLKVLPRPLFESSVLECPEMTHYMADQIENRNNDSVYSVAIEETVQCMFNGDETKASMAVPAVRSAVFQTLSQGDNQNEYTYRHLEDVLRRLASMPGERVLLLASPGFLLTTLQLDEMGIIDRANRSNIVINTLDARGLYTPAVMGDISKPIADTYKTAGFKATYRISAQQEQQYVLMDFALSTGGTFFHNSNDLQGGMKRAGEAPEISYVLGFSPQNQKMDGRYHTIKVTLSVKQKYTIQARRGYYAPRKAKDPLEQARAEIQEAVFSQDEIHELPLDLQTQYFKTNDAGAKLSVVSRIELKGMHFRKVDGRNFDNLTLATAVFDENGNFVTGGEKTLEMKLLDSTYERLSRTGFTVKSSFDVKPGRYMGRQVVRNSECAQLAARNGAVEIPY